MEDGTLVLIIGRLDTRIKDMPEGVVIGTFLGYFKKEHEDKVMVLLPDGNIFLGNKYEITPYEEQKSLSIAG